MPYYHKVSGTYVLGYTNPTFSLGYDDFPYWNNERVVEYDHGRNRHYDWSRHDGGSYHREGFSYHGYRGGERGHYGHYGRDHH